MKWEFLVNPILIPTANSDRIEYTVHKNGRRMIYVVRDTGGNLLEPYGTDTYSGYRPRGEIKYQTAEKISPKDEQLRKVSSELARRYKFWFQFLRSDFRNARFQLCDPIPFSTFKTFTSESLEEALKQYTKAKGHVYFYTYGYTKEVRFGPLIKISTKMERTKAVNSFVEELKPDVEELYRESNIFQTREKGFSILRKL